MSALLSFISFTLKYFLFIPVSSEYSIEDMALDGISVLDQLGIKKSHILGMSMGGMISQVLVAKHPSRIETFTLISSTASTPNPLNGTEFKVTRQMLKRTAAKDDIEGRIDQSIKLFELIGTPGTNYDTPKFRSDMRSYIKRGGDDSGFLRQMAAIIGSKNRILGPCCASPFIRKKSEAHALMIELTLFRLFARVFLFLVRVYRK